MPRRPPATPAMRIAVCTFLEAWPALLSLPVFTCLDTLFPFPELRPKKYQLSSRN
jgi:hypothetical protein